MAVHLIVSNDQTLGTHEIQVIITRVVVSGTAFYKF